MWAVGKGYTALEEVRMTGHVSDPNLSKLPLGKYKKLARSKVVSYKHMSVAGAPLGYLAWKQRVIEHYREKGIPPETLTARIEMVCAP